MLSRSVEVAAYTNSLEAGLAQGLLREEGVACEIDGLTSQSWLAGEIPIVGFRLMVPLEQAPQARAVLDEMRARRERARAQAPAPGPDFEDGSPSPETADERVDTRPWREALGPTAALGLALLASGFGPLTLLAALVWVWSLLTASPVADRLPPRTRLLLIGGLVLAIGATVAYGYLLPFADRFWWQWTSDGLLALLVLLGYLSARRRWRSR